MWLSGHDRNKNKHDPKPEIAQTWDIDIIGRSSLLMKVALAVAIGRYCTGAATCPVVSKVVA